jgi:hypothetical protein
MSESFQLYLDSVNADVNNNEYTFNLPLLEVQDGYYLYFSIVNCTIPYSFYNINLNNNILNYKINNINYTLIIPIGNYSINNLVSYLNSQLPNFTITYSKIFNKITFTNSLNDFILNASNFLLLIGFNNSNYISTSRTLISPNCININYVRCINLISNIITYNVNTSKNLVNNNNIICSIPVNTPANTLIQYLNTNNFRTNLFVNTLNKIVIKLVDNNNNIIDLNGLNFNLTVQLDVESFRQ